MHNPSSGRRQAIRDLLEHFIAERLATKLEGLAEEDPKRATLLAQYAPDVWLEDAARRAGQIQAVTHTLKAIHPDAKGTNLYCLPNSLPRHALVGSHCLGDDFAGDVVGNAAALDVYKLLKLEHDGQSLLSLLLADDADAIAALHEDGEQAQILAAAFTGITRARDGLASHTHGKQLYWLVGEDPRDDEQYHLIAPLYASSLAHRVYQQIQADRFGEPAKEARQARRDKQFHPGVIHEYPDLAVQKLGGTKPQNISQLNSERRGDNYLLASLPPSWQQREVRLPIRTRDGSIFPAFGQRPAVAELVRHLRDFLLSGPPPNVHTRNSRDELLTELIDELLLYAAELWAFEPGWSAKPECNLNRAEQLWLDFRRAEHDAIFASEWRRMEWLLEIRERFANWLNARLVSKLSVGDVENSYWAKQAGSNALWLDLDRLNQAWVDQFEREQRDLEAEHE
ncbi:type I-F CRISPR-associated protein Csy1 [Pseudomonas sp. GOM7]|uniref:type I-F CRISPR-associated protein Csy1 n=1 Tax=Pseudomonas sp. GOM7 TaxID=2998079 RepID=UPI00227CF644|nr:type I-F CRISPR-associated protein Csy1 [Pseudomonas sp. GOM7]WAJ37493.1 type I-F CRISPR-associated protein Csy1 [Pseudomonas sp. GOM7]